MEMTYEDIRNRFNDIVQDLRNEVAVIKKAAESQKKPKKRGRPNRFDSLEERDDIL